LYYAFRIAPFTKRVARALTKEQKLYLWDWSQVESEGARFENMVASHLLKAVHYWTDLGLGDFDLRYVRDREKREVDFVITESRRPALLVECTLRDESSRTAAALSGDARRNPCRPARPHSIGGSAHSRRIRTHCVRRHVVGWPAIESRPRVSGSHPRTLRDAFGDDFAALGLGGVHGMCVVTRNVTDYAPTGVPTLNPWSSATR
jgi:hypothetical protein